MKIRFLLLALTAAIVPPASAQTPRSPDNEEAAYIKVIADRAGKIVETLGVVDPSKAARLRDIVARQYRDLRAIHDERDGRLKAAKERTHAIQETAAVVKTAQDEARGKLDKLHADYLAKLSAELTLEQVDKVKDGMTYGVVQVTYAAYLKMLPELTDRQKARITAFLVEAREIAMDEGSAAEKHAVFGKYKGRINNYLSAAGYNLNEASKKLR